MAAGERVILHGDEAALYALGGRKWWARIISVELFGLLMLLAFVPLLTVNMDGSSTPLSRLRQAGTYLAGLFQWAPGVRENIQAVDGWAVLAVFATAGVASTVALNASLGRLEKMHQSFHAKDGLHEVVGVRQAELAQGSGLFLGLLAVTLSHIILIGAIASIVLGGQRGPAAVAASMAVFMTVFFVIECARLGTPSTPFLEVSNRAPSQDQTNRLRAAVRRVQCSTGVARRTLLLARASAIVFALVWWRFPVVLGHGTEDPRAAPLVLIVVIVMFRGISLCAEFIAKGATFERGMSRIATLVMSQSLTAMGWIVYVAALVSSLAPPDAWVGSLVQGGAVLVIVLIVGITEVFRVAGAAQIGPLRSIGLRGVLVAARLRRTPRPRWLSYGLCFLLFVLLALISAIAAHGNLGQGGVLLALGTLAAWGGLRSVTNPGATQRFVLAASIVAVSLGGFESIGLSVLIWSVVSLVMLTTSFWHVFPPARRIAEHVASIEVMWSRRRIVAALGRSGSTELWNESKAQRWAAKVGSGHC
ncbi:hypothetical protein [Brachybacterium sp. ACRRE]|uniref:hypothetical protein n=1 Tax=Brachybacterium sp. ACRRE TaxID=2918184 RepID=UPI001EF33414|nr:hypothetical protein [Brachybacterium sp. ACRRE]MCG7310297.1 hypothetical protein [Brachybacterium sp. ACRRE]